MSGQDGGNGEGAGAAGVVTAVAAGGGRRSVIAMSAPARHAMASRSPAPRPCNPGLVRFLVQLSFATVIRVRLSRLIGPVAFASHAAGRSPPFPRPVSAVAGATSTANAETRTRTRTR